MNDIESSAQAPRSGDPLRILHVVATGERRGAELFAADLVRGLDGGTTNQMVAVLRGSSAPAVQFEAPLAVLGGNGGAIPGLRIDLRVVRNLRGVLKRWRPDLVQVHGGEPLKHAIAAAPSKKVPIVYRRIGVSPDRLARWIPKIGYRTLFRRASRIVAVAEAVRAETVERFRVPPERVITIPNGVDPARMVSSKTREETRRSLGIAPESRVLVSLGALTWEKDPLAHLEVASRLTRERSDVVHLIVGGGPMRTTLQSSIDRLGLRDRVLVLGPRRDVPDLLAAGDAVLFASRSDGMEGMPASLIEAGMVGLPVAAYSVAGVSEIVADQRTGLLVPAGDVGALTRSAAFLLDDRAANRRMAEAARERCVELFDISRIAPRYLEMYREVAGR